MNDAEINSESKPLAISPQVESMFKAGVHFAYKKTRRHPKMREYIAGVRSNVEVFHLDKVQRKLEEALNFIHECGKNKRTILWVGTKPAASAAIELAANELGHPYVTGRWLGGTITNFKVIRGRVDRMIKLINDKEKGELSKYKKQEQLKISEEIERLVQSFGSLKPLSKLPEALIVVDSKHELTAVTEAAKKNIPVIAIANSDCNPEEVSYVVPANDNAPKSIKYIVEAFLNAYKKGIKEAIKTKEEKETKE